VRIELADHVVGQDAQLFLLAAVMPVLEGAEAHERRRHARDDGGGLDGFAHHLLVRTGEHQGARGRNAERGHGFGAQEFADRGAQHGAAVAHARVGRHAGAFQLQLHRPLRSGQRAQQDGAAVAQLAGPVAELVAGVHGGQRQLRAAARVAAEHRDEIFPLRQIRRVEPGQRRRLAAGRDEIGRGQGRRHQARVERGRQFGEGIVEGQIVSADGTFSRGERRGRNLPGF
jgi:hypothetical protein